MPITRRYSSQPINETNVDLTMAYADTEPASLTPFLRKLDHVLENLGSIAENVSKIVEFLPTLSDIQSQRDQSTSSDNTDSGRTLCERATQELTERIKELINETNQPTIERDALQIKRSLENTWSKNLLNRRQQF